LCGIARNLSRHGDRQCEISDIDAVQLASSDTVDALALIEAAEAEHDVRSALDDVPPSDRELLVLFYWERKSLERVELSEPAAQKRITRARRMITREIAERFVTTAEARRPPTAAAAAVAAMIETNGGRVNRVGRKAAADALPMRLAVPAAATCAAAIAIITGVVWLL
jgi:hypothetical protein